MKPLEEQLREAATEGKLFLEAADMGEGDDSVFRIDNVEVGPDGRIVLSSNDYLCRPRSNDEDDPNACGIFYRDGEGQLRCKACDAPVLS